MTPWNVRATAAAGATGLALLALAGCSSSGSGNVTPEPTPTETATSAPSPTATAAVFNQKVQSELAQVGCYHGNVDGRLGPESVAALKAFQQGVGLPVDGEFGPNTAAALIAAVAEGRQVCTATASPTTSPTATPTASPVVASCTGTSIQSALGGGTTVLQYNCATVSGDQWAAGQFQPAGDAPETFFLQAMPGSTWTRVDVGDVCGAASAGLPNKILRWCSIHD